MLGDCVLRESEGFEKLLSQIGTKGNQSVQKVYWSCNDRKSLTLRKIMPALAGFYFADSEGVAFLKKSVTRFEAVASDFAKIVTTGTEHVMF